MSARQRAAPIAVTHWQQHTRRRYADRCTNNDSSRPQQLTLDHVTEAVRESKVAPGWSPTNGRDGACARSIMRLMTMVVTLTVHPGEMVRTHHALRNTRHTISGFSANVRHSYNDKHENTLAKRHTA